MAVHKWKNVRRGGSPDQEAESKKWVEAQMLEMDLRAIRELAGKTQKNVADITDMGQGGVSEFERREDHRVSGIRRYVEALGGELEITARFGDKTVKLRGV